MSLYINKDIIDDEIDNYKFEEITELYFVSENPVVITKKFIDSIHKFINLKKLNFRHKNIKIENNYIFDNEKIKSLTQNTTYNVMKNNIDMVKNYLDEYKEECLKIKRELKTKFFAEFAKLKIDTLIFDYMDYDDLLLFYPKKIFILRNPLLTFSSIDDIIYLLKHNKVKILDCQSSFDTEIYSYEENELYKIYQIGNFNLNNNEYAFPDKEEEDYPKDLHCYKLGHYTSKEFIKHNKWMAFVNVDFTSKFVWNDKIANKFQKIIKKQKFIKFPFVIDDEVVFEPLIYNYKDTFYINNMYLQKIENDITKINPNVKTLYLTYIDKNMYIPITTENIIYTGNDDETLENLENLKVPFNCNTQKGTFKYKLIEDYLTKDSIKEDIESEDIEPEDIEPEDIETEESETEESETEDIESEESETEDIEPEGSEPEDIETY